MSAVDLDTKASPELRFAGNAARASFDMGIEELADALDAKGSERTGRLVDLILADALRCSASDVL